MEWSMPEDKQRTLTIGLNLELSGVRQPEVLKKVVVEVFHDLPGVGNQLQDHQIIRMRWRIARKLIYNEQVYGWCAMRSVINIFSKGLVF